MAPESDLTGTFGKAAMWVVGGLASCVFAHALMIPTGIEQWLHTSLAGLGAAPETLQAANDILSYGR